MAPSFVLAASDLVDRWRDIGPVLWVAAGATFVVWIATLAVLAARSEPRDVAPGPGQRSIRVDPNHPRSSTS